MKEQDKNPKKVKPRAILREKREKRGKREKKEKIERKSRGERKKS